MGVLRSSPAGLVRIGAGAGYAGDRIDPAVDLARRGNLDHLVFECLGERTIAAAQLARAAGTAAGYDPLLDERMRAVLPLARASGTRIVTNMGAADPEAAAEATLGIARELGLAGFRVAAVTGDDVIDVARDPDGPLAAAVTALPGQLASANAYLGAGPIAAALEQGADVVIVGRTTDSALFLGPLLTEFGWDATDYDRLAAGIVVGHLLECAGQLTGGYFADPIADPVPDPARLGFPFAEVDSTGAATFGKLPGTGGRLDRATATVQLLYEVTDPACYLTPDVNVDLTGVEIIEDGPDRVTVRGAIGSPPPSTLKVLLGHRDGVVGEGEISYAGPGARARAECAGEIVTTRLRDVHRVPLREVRCELIGTGGDPAADPPEVRLRVAAKADTAEAAALVGREVETLYTNGPAGGGGVRARVREVLAVAAATLPHEIVRPSVHLEVAR